jgi:hypothetical protein
MNSSENIKIVNLAFEGPNLNINGEEATLNRQRISGRVEGGVDNGQDFGCFLYKTQSECPSTWRDDCRWSSTKQECLGKNFSYYSGAGI